MARRFIGHQSFKGRGAVSNPSVRFESLTLEQTHDGWYEEEVPAALNETVLPDRARSVITTNDSPDVGFDKSINPYRGCAHGCVYCFARPSHAYLGLSPGLDFETKLFYKENAVALLEAELAKPRYVCTPIALGINTDGYQPLEKRLEITRSILTVLARCRHPVTIVTKSAKDPAAWWTKLRRNFNNAKLTDKDGAGFPRSAAPRRETLERSGYPDRHFDRAGDTGNHRP